MTGFLGYYRKYIQNYARWAKPLYDLLQKSCDKNSSKSTKRRKGGNNNAQLPSGQTVIWTDKHQKAVNEIVDILLTPQVMAYPNLALGKADLHWINVVAAGVEAARGMMPSDQTIVSLHADEVRKAQENDEIIGPVLLAKKEGQRLPKEKLSTFPKDTQKIFREWNRLKLDVR